LTFQTLPIDVDLSRADDVVADKPFFTCLAFTLPELLAVLNIEANSIGISIIRRFHGKDSFSDKPNLQFYFAASFDCMCCVLGSKSEKFSIGLSHYQTLSSLRIFNQNQF
jgi:hypothetical protein